MFSAGNAKKSVACFGWRRFWALIGRNSLMCVPKIGRYRPVTRAKVMKNRGAGSGSMGRTGSGIGFSFQAGRFYPVSITVSTNVVSWLISIGSSPFSTARKIPEMSMSRSLLVTKWMNLLILGDER